MDLIQAVKILSEEPKLHQEKNIRAFIQPKRLRKITPDLQRTYLLIIVTNEMYFYGEDRKSCPAYLEPSQQYSHVQQHCKSLRPEIQDEEIVLIMKFRAQRIVEIDDHCMEQINKVLNRLQERFKQFKKLQRQQKIDNKLRIEKKRRQNIQLAQQP